LFDFIDGIDLGMGLSCFFMPAFPDYFILINNYGAYQRVWVGVSQGFFGQRQTTLHKRQV
jgi:hypothetical protein